MGWETSKLGDACEIIKRGVSPKYIEDGGICVVNQKCVRDHRVSYALARRHDIEVKKVNEERYIKVGDVLVNSTGTGTLGRVAQVRTEPPELTTVDTHVTIVRPKSGLFHDVFFGYMLIKIEEEITAAGEGASGQTELARTKLENEFFVSYPESIPEQKRIVAILDQAFADIDKASANAEQNLKNSRELFESYLQQVFSQRGEGWVDCRMSDICEITSKLVDPKEEKYLDLYHVGAGNMVSMTGELVKVKTAREEGLISGKFVFDDSMVLYSKIRPYLTKVTRPDFTGLCSADVYPLSPLRNKVDKHYLFYLLLSKGFTNYAILGSGRAGMPKVNRTHLFNYLVRIPSIEKQREYVIKIDQIAGQSQMLERLYSSKLLELDALKKSILQKAFSGEFTRADKEAESKGAAA